MFTSKINPVSQNPSITSDDPHEVMALVNDAATELRRMYTAEAAKFPHQSVHQQRWLAKAFGVDTFCDSLFARSADELREALREINDEIAFESSRLERAS